MTLALPGEAAGQHVGNEQTAARDILNFAAMWRGGQEFPGSISFGADFDLTTLEDSVQN